MIIRTYHWPLPQAVHTLSSYFLNINFSIILPSVLWSEWSLTFRFSNQNPICIFVLSHMCHMPCLSHTPWFHHTNHTFVKHKDCEAPQWALFTSFLSHCPFQFQMFSSLPCVCVFFPHCEKPHSHPNKTTRKITRIRRTGTEFTATQCMSIQEHNYSWKPVISFLLFILSLCQYVTAEHSELGLECRRLIDTADRDEVDDLDDPPTPVCYFIVGGNEEECFAIEPLRHEIMVSSHKKESRKMHSNKVHVLYKFILCNLSSSVALIFPLFQG